MANKKTSSTQKKSLKTTKQTNSKKLLKPIPYSPLKELTNEKFIGGAIVECLRNNDPEGVMEVLSYFLDAVEKTQFTKKADMPKSTLYHSLKSKNPTIKTLAKIVHATAPLPSTKK